MATLDYSGTDQALVIDLEENTVTNAVRILTIGDSLTAGFYTNHAYRLELWRSIAEERGLWLDFVGPEGDPAGDLVDVDNWGVSGYRVNDFAPNMNFVLGSTNADVVLIMLGTNDALVEYLGNPNPSADNDPSVTVPLELLELLRNAHAAQPGVPLLLSELPPLDPSIYTQFSDLNADGDEIVDAINAQLPAIVAQAQSEGINVTLVSQSNFTLDMLSPSDGIHPTDEGDATMAGNFQAALDALMAEMGGTYFGTPSPITPTDDVIGSDAGDRIKGNGNVNNIDGGAGNDWIEGRGGADILTGGSGRDTFAILAPSEAGDTITDFVSGEDRIVINATNFPGVEPDTTLEFVVDGTPSGTGPAVVYNSTTGELFYDEDGSGAAAQILLATLTGAPAIVADDVQIIGQNLPPEVANPIADESVSEFEYFSFTIPADTFSDPDFQALELTATLANGDPLPEWLSFNPATRAFTGVAPGDAAGTLSIRVTATDPYDSYVSDTFDLNIGDRPDPTQDGTITARGDDTFTIYVNGTQVGQGLYWTDVNVIMQELTGGDVIAIRATNSAGPGAFFADIRLEDGTKIGTSDDWKVANVVNGSDWTSQTYDDSAWANATEYGSLNTAPWNAPDPNEPVIPGDSTGQWIWDSTNNQSGETVYFRFVMPYVEANEDPVLDNPIADQDATEESAFSFTVPANTFSDPNTGEELTLSAALENGDPLPSWLSFDAETGEFSGTPDDPDLGTINVRVTATDPRGATVSDVFSISTAGVNDAPTVENAIADQATDEEAAFSFIVPANTFEDVDGDDLTLSAELENGDPLPSWLSFNPSTGEFSGTPDDADIGTISVRVIADDGNGESVSDVFDLTVNAVNDAPTVANEIADQATDEEAAFSFTVPANTFEDAEGDDLTLSAELENGDPLPSWLSFDPETGEFSGTPDDAEVGTISVRVIANDGNGGEVSDLFDLTVNPVNDAPVGNDDTASGFDNEVITIDVLDNDTDVDGPSLTITEVEGQAISEGNSVDIGDAIVTLNGGMLEFAAKNGTVGDVTFAYTVSDGDLSDTADVTVSVTKFNLAPTATDDSDTTLENTPITLDVLANDTDPNIADTLTITHVNGQAIIEGGSVDVGDATVTLNGGKLDVTPDTGFFGELNFSYTMTDGEFSDDGDVALMVTEANDTPVANDDTATTDEDVAVEVDVLANDTDENLGDTLTISHVAGQAIAEGETVDVGDAMVTLNGGKLLVTPDAGFFGDVVFEYTTTDGELSDNGTVTVTVNEVNDAPTANNDSGSVSEDGIVNLDLIANDVDTNTGDSVSVTMIDGQVATVDVPVVLASGATATLLSDGTVDYNAAGAFDSLDTGESTSDSFSYTIADTEGLTSTATVTLTITGANDAPVVTAPASVTALAGATGIALAGITVADADDDSVFVTISNGDGALSVSETTGLNFTIGDGTDDHVMAFSGSLADVNAALASLSYDTAPSDRTGETITISVFDGTATSNGSVQVILENADPVAQDDGFSTGDTVGTSGNLFADNGNGVDSDANGDQLTVTQVNGNPANVGSQFTLASGALLTVLANGDFAYDPNGVHQGLLPGQQATETFTYMVSDGFGGTDTATATITIVGSLEGNDRIFGTALADMLDGGNGDDDIFGRDGNDSLSGGEGNDIIRGEGGNDNIDGGNGNDTVVGGLGDDLIYGGAGMDTLYGSEGNDQFFGGADNDYIDGGVGNDVLRGEGGDDTLIGGPGNDLLSGGDGNDLLKGGDGIDEIYGGAGIDSVFGGAGNDLIFGGTGNDVLRGEAGNDEIFGDLGDDMIVGGEGNDRILGGDGNDELYGNAGIDDIFGGAGDDRIFGGDDGDILRGDEGNDLIEGQGGNDVIVGGAGNDILRGGDGFDEIYGGEGNDDIFGGSGSDYLDGGAGNDTIRGNASADLIIGGIGDDVIVGGEGLDTYRFDVSHLGSDTVYGFEAGETVDLTNFGYASEAEAANDFQQVGSNVVFSKGGVTVTFLGATLANVVNGITLDSSASFQQGGALSFELAVVNEDTDSFDFSGQVNGGSYSQSGFEMPMSGFGSQELNFQTDQSLFDVSLPQESSIFDWLDIGSHMPFDDFGHIG